MIHGPLATPDPLFWPSPDAFIDLSAAATFSDGTASCTGIAVCDEYGVAITTFEQGHTAYVYGEFHVLADYDVASCGLEFRDPTGRTIHGKNSFQTGGAVLRVRAGSRLRFRYTLPLAVAVDDYVFSIGLASASVESYHAYREGRLPHVAFETIERCRVVDAGQFVVRLPESGGLTHHGLVDLPVRCDLTVDRQPGDRGTLSPAAARTPPAGTPSTSATIFHVTHWKAGSQWIHRILRDCVPDLIVPPRLSETQFVNWPIRRGGVYPTVYVSKQQYDRVDVPSNSQRFVVIRDLRDTLVSAYFSFAFSHPVQDSTLGHLRATLPGLSREDGLLYLLRQWLPGCANIQASWVEAAEPLVRYEDLLVGDVDTLEPVLIDRCGLPVSRDRFRQVVYQNRFEELTRRRRGEEDITAHERIGTAGDWRNHFTDRVAESFRIRYGALLVATGYERDLNW